MRKQPSGHCAIFALYAHKWFITVVLIISLQVFQVCPFSILLFWLGSPLLTFSGLWYFQVYHYWPRRHKKEIQPVHSKGDQSWMFFGRNDAKDETPVLWSPHAKSWLIGKDSDAGRDWGQDEKGTTEDEMAGWHHRLHGREFEWTLGVGDGQGGLACCNSWGRKESDMTKQLNWIELRDKNCQWNYRKFKYGIHFAFPNFYTPVALIQTKRHHCFL